MNANSSATSENILVISWKVKHTLNIWCSNPHSKVSTQRIKTHAHTKPLMHMFLSALFIIATPIKKGNNPTLNVVIYPYNGILLSQKEKKDWTTDTHKSMTKSQKHKLSERNQNPKTIMWCHLYEILEKAKLEYPKESLALVCLALGCGQRLTAKGQGEFLGGDKSMMRVLAA